MASTVHGRGRASAAEEAWVLLRRMLMSERRRFLAAASELELHPAQAGALLQMEPDMPLPMHELASILACDNSNVTGIVDRLEARGLVARQAYAPDRRVKHIVLTPLGVELREAMDSRMANGAAVLGRLSGPEQRQLRDLLRKALSA
jgi:MarR family transcriptional regulator, organic hydroperoxide resistance regulator